MDIGIKRLANGEALFTLDINNNITLGAVKTFFLDVEIIISGILYIRSIYYGYILKFRTIRKYII